MGEKTQSETNKTAVRNGRQERLANALRANLNRRKEQLRARRDQTVDTPPDSVETEIEPTSD